MARKEKETKENSSKSKKKTGLGPALILLAVLVLFIIFLVKKDVIITNLKETRFFDRVFGSTPEFVENHQTVDKSKDEKIPLTEEGTVTIKVETEKPAKQPSKTEAPAKQENKVPAVENKQEASEEKKPEVKTEPKKETVTTQITYTDLQLCFVEIDSEGYVNRKMIKRSIPKNDSPLTTSIQLLLQGPDTTKSVEKNCMTLIPSGTKLLSAKVKDGVANLNFSEDFEINPAGVEGYNAQLMQIVYTATTFSTVNSVQFLIEGEKKEYLGSEGQWIGSPLSRNSF